MPWLATSGVGIVPASLFVGVFSWLSVAVGRRLLAWLGVPADGSPVERGIAALALGASALQFVPFALGATGTLGVTSLRVAVLLVLVVSVPDLLAVARRTRSLLSGARKKRPEGWLLAGTLVLLPPLVVAALVALSPTLDPDGLSYHLTVPKRWLAQGSLAYLPTYPYSNTPMGVEMLFAIAMVFAGDAGAKLLHFTLGLAGALGLCAAGKRLRSEAVGAVAAGLYLVGPAGVAHLLGCAYLEGITAFATIAATLAWLVWFRERDRSWLRAAALLGGMGVAFKITAALFPVALGALTVLVLWDESRGRPGEFLRKLASEWSLVPLVAGPVLPWFARAALVTGNPVFPIFAQWIPSRDLSPELAASFERYNRYMLWAIRVGAGWSLEQRRSILFGVALLAVVVTAVLFFRLRSRVERGAAIILLGTALVQLFAVGLYTRYWIPMLAVVQLPVLALVDSALAGRLRGWAVVALGAGLSVLATRRSLGEGGEDLKGLLAIALGVEDRRTFLGRNLGLLPIYEHANRVLPPTAGVLLSCYCAGFYIDRTTYCAEFVQSSLRITTWDEFIADFRRLGVSHVVAPTALATGGPDPPLDPGSVAMIHRHAEYEILRRLLGTYGTLSIAALDQGLYSIDTEALARDTAAK